MNKKLTMLCVGAFLAIFSVIIYYSFVKNVGDVTVTQLLRPDGTQPTEYDIKAVCGDELKNITVTVDPKAPTSKELESMFDVAYAQVRNKVLSDNESAEFITSGLDLVTEIKELNMGVEWHLSDYKIIDSFGDIHPVEEPVRVMIEVILRYRGKLASEVEPERHYEFSVIVAPKTVSFENDIDGIIADMNNNSLESEYLILPNQYGQQGIAYYSEGEKADISFLAVLLPVPVLLLFLGKSQEKDKQKKRRERMAIQYPDIITKLSLLIGAGMTPYNALVRIAEDGSGEAYDELRHMVSQIESGSSPVKEYALMGKRFGLQCYSKLGSMLGQNHTKGNEYFRNMLREEAFEAMEDRKGRAKKAGERAGTLMLIPMISMLAVVMAIVMVPAFMSF